MTIDRSDRWDEHATVTFMRWAPVHGEGKRSGLRVGYGNAFCFIPEDEAVNLATALLDYIEANQLHRTHDTTSPTSTGN